MSKKRKKELEGIRYEAREIGRRVRRREFRELLAAMPALVRIQGEILEDNRGLRNLIADMQVGFDEVESDLEELRAEFDGMRDDRTRAVAKAEALERRHEENITEIGRLTRILVDRDAAIEQFKAGAIKIEVKR